MKGLIASLALAVTACSAGDDGIAEGARTQCAFGGELTDCPDPYRTPAAACWRMVDCGAIPLDGENRFDWNGCVGELERMRAERQRLVINCIAASTCDQLRDTEQDLCFALGGQ